MDGFSLLESYGWLQDYVWQRLEPALSQVETVVRMEDPYLFFDQFAANGHYYPFSGSLQIRKYVLGFFRKTDVIMYFECSIALASLPDHKLECVSYVAKTESGLRSILSEGPSVEMKLGDDTMVRRQVDRWIEATVKFIGVSTDLIVREVAPDR